MRVASPLNDGDRLSRPVPQRPDAEEVRSRLRSIAASDPSQDDTAAEIPARSRTAEPPGSPGQERADRPVPEPRVARQSEPMSAPQPQPSQSSPSTSARIAALRPGREPGDPARPVSAEGSTATFDGAKGTPVIDTRAGRDRKVGGKPRFLGLMLTSALLVFLVAVAAWASFNTEGGLARILRPASETQIAARPNADSASQASGAAQLAALDTGDDAAGGTATKSDAGNWQDSTAAPAQLAAGERDTNGERP